MLYLGCNMHNQREKKGKTNAHIQKDTNKQLNENKKETEE